MSTDTTVCLIGLGQMGQPVARRLIEAGFSVRGADPSADARERLEVAGGQAYSRSAEAAVGAGWIVTLLPNGKVVRDALLGGDGAIDAAEQSTLIIDMSSSAPSDTVSLGHDLGRLGIELVDAPLSGGVKRASEGKLAVMLGGTDRACERSTPVLSPIASAVHRTGGLGSGHAMKAINNFSIGLGTAAAMEALLLGQRFGILPETVIDVLNGSSGRNNATEVKMKQFVLSGTFASGFATGLMAKDVSIAADMAASMGLQLPVLQDMADLWRRAAAALGESADHTEMIRFIEEIAGRPTL